MNQIQKGVLKNIGKLTKGRENLRRHVHLKRKKKEFGAG